MHQPPGLSCHTSIWFQHKLSNRSRALNHHRSVRIPNISRSNLITGRETISGPRPYLCYRILQLVPPSHIPLVSQQQGRCPQAGTIEGKQKRKEGKGKQGGRGSWSIKLEIRLWGDTRSPFFGSNWEGGGAVISSIPPSSPSSASLISPWSLLLSDWRVIRQNEETAAQPIRRCLIVLAIERWFVSC